MHWVVRYNAQNTLFHQLQNAPPRYEGECTLVEVSSTGELSLPKVAKPIYIQLNKAVKGVEIKSYRYQIYADESRDTIEQTSSVSVPVIMRIIESAVVEKQKTVEAGEGSGRVGRNLRKKEIESQKSASCDSILCDWGSDISCLLYTSDAADE